MAKMGKGGKDRNSSRLVMAEFVPAIATIGARCPLLIEIAGTGPAMTKPVATSTIDHHEFCPSAAAVAGT